MSKSRPSRVKREKAKHRTGLLKYLTRINKPAKQKKNQQDFRDELNAFARRHGMPEI